MKDVMGQDEDREWIKFRPGTVSLLFPGDGGDARSQVGSGSFTHDTGGGAARSAELAVLASASSARSPA